MNDFVIISEGKYPNESAGAIRQHSIAKLLKSFGYSPFIISLGKSTNFDVSMYDNIKYVSLRHKNNSLTNRIFNLVLFTKRMKKYIDDKNIKKILVIKIPILSLLYLKKLAKKNNIQLFHDSVEWYSPEEFRLRWFSPEYIKNNLYNRCLIDKNFKVLSISSFLHTHYLSRNIESFNLPVILDVENMTYNKNTKKQNLVLLYAGSVGRKDHLITMIKGLSLLSHEELLKIEFRIFGVDTNTLRKNLDDQVFSRVCPILNCFGKVNRETVLKNLEEADFTVLLRNAESRYAKAGFPTKVVESLASATPVILNVSSDLSKYLENEEDSIFVNECSPTAFCESIRFALNLSEEKKKLMQKQARKNAENNFDFRKYKNIKSFIN